MGYASGGGPGGQSFSIAIGPYAGRCAGSNSISMGWAGGYKNTGNLNVIIGSDAVCDCSTSSGNTQAIVGAKAGMKIGSSGGNALLGFAAGCSLTTSGGNVFLGKYAGKCFTGGVNIAIGYGA